MIELIDSYHKCATNNDMLDKRNVHLTEGFLALGYFYHQI